MHDYVSGRDYRGLSEVEFLLDLSNEMYETNRSMFCIAGGYARWMMLPYVDFDARPSDIDLFFNSEDAYDLFKKLFSGYYPDVTWSDSRVSGHYSISKKNREEYDDLRDVPVRRINLVKPMNENAMVGQWGVNASYQLLENFDFTVIKALFDPFTMRSIEHKDFLQHNREKRLVIENIHCPISTTHRMNKYVAKGFRIGNAEILKVLEDWRWRDEEYRDSVLMYISLTPEDRAEMNETELTRLQSLVYLD